MADGSDFAQAIQRGATDCRYEGVPTLKCPFDLEIYRKLIWDLTPATILEFGSYKGCGALWLADRLRAYALQSTRLVTLDIQKMHEFRDPRVEFVPCDVNNIAASLSDEMISQFAHPFLVIEESSHQAPHVRNVMDFFHKHARPGEYLIVEDGILSLIMDETEFQGGLSRPSTPSWAVTPTLTRSIASDATVTAGMRRGLSTAIFAGSSDPGARPRGGVVPAAAGARLSSSSARNPRKRPAACVESPSSPRRSGRRWRCRTCRPRRRSSPPAC